MNNRASRVTDVDVGAPLERQTSDFENEETIKVHFHGFANLPAGRGGVTKSPEFACLGHRWILIILPDVHERVVVCLQHMSDESIGISYSFSVRNSTGKQVAHLFQRKILFPGGEYQEGCKILGKRTTLMETIRRGTLTIEVHMRTATPSSHPSAAEFIPENPLRQNILQLFGDEDFADVVFRVGGQQSRSTRKKAKTSSVDFHAHRNILQKGAPELARMCRPGGSDAAAASAPISIPGVTADIFRTLLYYVYGGKVSDEDLDENAKDLIQAADKFGVVSLKLEAELQYVKSTKLTVENVIDNFMYADSMNCALLKEAAMDFVVENKDDIIGSVSFDDVPGSAMTDLLAAMARGERKVDGAGDRTNFNAMRVGTLRSMLHEKGLNVDGSREAMIAMLKQNSLSSSSPPLSSPSSLPSSL